MAAHSHCVHPRHSCACLAMQVAGHLFEGRGSGSYLAQYLLCLCCQLSLSVSSSVSLHVYHTVQKERLALLWMTLATSTSLCRYIPTSQSLPASPGTLPKMSVSQSQGHEDASAMPWPSLHEVFVMQTGPRGQREWKFYETVQHEKQAAAATSSTVGAPHDPWKAQGTAHGKASLWYICVPLQVRVPASAVPA